MMNAPLACDTLIYAPYILTQNLGREILTDAAIAITGGKITAIGKATSLFSIHAKETLHLDHCMIMPGLVNAHTHVAMTYLRGLADDLPLMEWLNRYIFPVEKHLTQEIVELASLLGCAEMISTGTTAFQDMYLYSNAVGKAVDQSGMKALIGEVLFSFESPAYATEDAALDLLENQLTQWKEHPRVRLAVMPHSVYTVAPSLLSRSLSFAQKNNLPIHTHLAETSDESASCIEQHGLRPVAYCDSLGLFDHNVSIAHGVDITPEEMILLAQHKTVVAHNPKSNMKLASGIAPILAMQQAGVPLALGTDSAASNNSLNLFSDMSACALLHKVAHKDSTIMPAQTVLDMATLGSAKALFWEGLGHLSPGASADLIALDLRAPNLQPMYNPVSHAVYAASGHEVCLSMVDGRILYKDGAFISIDYPLILQEMKKLMAWVQTSRQS